MKLKLVVKQIACAPFKSGALNFPGSSYVGILGLVEDRICMAANAVTGKLLSFRENGGFATITSAVEDNCIVLRRKGQNDLILPWHKRLKGERRVVQLHDWRGELMDVGEEAASWLHVALEEPAARLVCLPYDFKRQMKRDPQHGMVALQDGYSISVLSEESVAVLNDQTDEEVPAEQFRSNIVIGCAAGSVSIPFLEDQIWILKIGNTILESIRHIPRCAMVNRRLDGSLNSRVLATLGQFRTHVHGGERDICFGSYFAPRTSGHAIHVGDEVEVLAWQP